MKKCVSMFLGCGVFFLMVILSGCATSDPVDGIKGSPYIHPLVGAATIQNIVIAWADEKDPYKLRFVAEFDRLIKAEAFWLRESEKSVIRDGIDIYDIDAGYTKLVTLDMRIVKKYAGEFGSHITLLIGCSNPVSGHPNFREISIQRDTDVPEEERYRYFEATPLKITYDGETYKTMGPSDG